MFATYYNCRNLIGPPVCGPNVENFYATYCNCFNLTGSPVCGAKVISFEATYNDCHKLTGSPVCGPNVLSMRNAYSGCVNLSGNPVCGDNVVNLDYTYYNCHNLYGEMYINYNGTDAVSANRCFYGRNASNKLTIYIKPNSLWNNWFYEHPTEVTGTTATWTLIDGVKYYNTAINIVVRFSNSFGNITLNAFNMTALLTAGVAQTTTNFTYVDDLTW